MKFSDMLKQAAIGKVACGFRYEFEQVCPKTGIVLNRQVEHNLMPIEGLNYLITAALLGGSQLGQWYLAPYEGAYDPQPLDTMATFPGSATELTAYVSATRPLVQLAAASGGTTDNSANRIELVGTTNGKFVTGGFISSSPTKGATTGVLLSAVRLPSPEPLRAGGIVRATAGFVFVSI